MARLTCVRAVAGLMKSVSAISSLLKPAGDERDDLALAVGELVRAPSASTDRCSGRAGELGDEPAGDARRQQRLAGRGARGRPAAGRPARCPSAGSPLAPDAQGLEDVLVEVEGGEDHAPSRRRRSGVGDDRRVASSPSTLGHADVHDARRRGAAAGRRRAPPAPSAASPTTSMSSSASSSTRRPARISAWSSASTTRITAGTAVTGRAARRAAPGSRRPGRGPASSVAAHALRPARACRRCRGPAVAVGTAAPRPSSTTSMSRIVGSCDRRSRARPRPGVAHHVGERLLHDAVGGHVDRRGQTAPSTASTAQLDRQARLARCCSTSAVEAVEPGRRRQRGAAVVASARSTWSVARSSSSVSLLACLMPAARRRACSGWRVDHVRAPTPAWMLIVAMPWAIDVVQVAGDAQPLLGHSPPGLLLPALLEVAGPLLQLGQVGAPVAGRVADEHRGADQLMKATWNHTASPRRTRGCRPPAGRRPRARPARRCRAARARTPGCRGRSGPTGRSGRPSSRARCTRQGRRCMRPGRPRGSVAGRPGTRRPGGSWRRPARRAPCRRRRRCGW